MSKVEPVEDWATDWDHHAPEWVNDAFSVWSELREQCPIAHTARYNEGVWLPTRYEDITAIAHDTTVFSSGHDGVTAGGSQPRGKFPPIHNDPPDHLPLRRAILPFFNPARVQEWEPSIRAHCEELAADLAHRDTVDLATDYAGHIPAAAIAAILGISPEGGDQFRRWIAGLEVGEHDTEVRAKTLSEMASFFAAEIADRRTAPRDDLISHLVTCEVDGEPLDDDTLQRILTLQLVAGIDTTWGVLGASLMHLATHPEDRQRLVADPSLIATAVEELLRAYASVSLFRKVTEEVEIGGVTMHEGDTLMIAFPAACRDPQQFERADEVVIDRQRNRHVAFGAGIHRCLGSNLARLELNIAIETWLRLVPEFELQEGAEVRWAEGAIRGPRSVPVTIG